MAKAQEIATLEAMKVLGYTTHDQQGNMFQETKAVINELGVRVTESHLLGTKIAEIWTRAREAEKAKETVGGIG